MLAVDHPLSEQGIQEAINLRAAIHAAGTRMTVQRNSHIMSSFNILHISVYTFRPSYIYSSFHSYILTSNSYSVSLFSFFSW